MRARLVCHILHAVCRIIVDAVVVIILGPLLDIPMETFQKTFESGILATLRLIKAVVPHMASRKRGIIVNVGSMTGQMLVVSYSLYHHSTDNIIHLVQLPGVVHTAPPNQPFTP
jgi:short-subunit dehydrogenase